MAGRANFFTLLPVAALALTLSACTPIGQFIGPGGPGAAGPTTSRPPTPSATPSPDPTSTDCDDAVFTEPGEYLVGDCVRLIEGRFNQLGVHGSVERVAVDGDDNEVLADGDVGSVEVRGERNVVNSQP